MVLLLCVLLSGTAPHAASGQEPAPAPKPAGQEPPAVAPQERLELTHHVLELPGKTLKYMAKAGEILVGEEKAKSRAKIFYVSYELENANKTARPVTFAFNGGPGAASLWLHLGALGPARVALQETGRPLPPPGKLANNEQSWLAFTDLVFIDPVGTGYSRALPGSEGGDKSFWGVEQDVKAVAECIRLYLTRNERWLSPKYLVGESYGTLRAAALAPWLQQKVGVDLNGIVLVSPVLEMDTLVAAKQELPYALFLPSYAAAARFHGKASQGRSLKETLAEAERFAFDEYLPGLVKGGSLAPEATEKLQRSLAGFVGLPYERVARLGGRVRADVFFKELLAKDNLLLGRMDSTLSGMDPNPERSGPAYDPCLDTLAPAFAAAANAYFRETLQYKTDAPYEHLNGEVGRNWDWSSGLDHGQGYVEAVEELRQAMSVNPRLRVLVCSGYYDLATPYFATQYTFNKLARDPRLRERVLMTYYESGHMLFTHKAGREGLFKDAEQFYKTSLP
jgi:carboxypeptidase C (cathepsin A)